MPAAEQVHGTLIARAGAGVLLRGPSGAGKSDLALRLLARGWQLVADDRIVLSMANNTVLGAAPAAIAGLLEVRGVGIVPVPNLPSARICLVIDLVPMVQVPRLPEPEMCELAGVQVPNYRLHSFESSAPDKLELLLQRCLST